MFGLDKRKSILIAGSVMAVVTLFYILSTALPSWAKSGYYEYGLWKACVSFVGQSACSDYSDAAITGKLQGARAFMIMVVIASALATISILINLLLPDSNTIKDQATKFAALVAIPLGIIGVALGLSYFSGGNGSLGAAAALGIVAVILNVAGAIVAFTVQ